MNSAGGVTMTAGRWDAVLEEASMAAAWTEPAPPELSWRHSDDTIELCGKLPQVANPRHRELMLAGGAVLLNLRILIRGLGVHPAVRTLPDPNRRDLIAVVRLEGIRPVTGDDRVLVDAMVNGPNGHPLNRRPEVPEAPTGPPLLTTLRRAARAEQAWLAVQDGADPGFKTSLPDLTAMDDGPTTMLIIGTVLDDPAARLQAGQAAQRVVLTAATAGVPVRSLNAVLGQPAHRRFIRELVGGGLWPQAVLGLRVDS